MKLVAIILLLSIGQSCGLLSKNKSAHTTKNKALEYQDKMDHIVK